MASLHNVSQKYSKSISCVLGNSFIFGNDPERSKVKDIISNVAKMIMDAKRHKKGFSELVSSETYCCIMKSMRVPDWTDKTPQFCMADLAELDPAWKRKVMHNFLDIIRVYIIVISGL